MASSVDTASVMMYWKTEKNKIIIRGFLKKYLTIISLTIIALKQKYTEVTEWLIQLSVPKDLTKTLDFYRTQKEPQPSQKIAFKKLTFPFQFHHFFSKIYKEQKSKFKKKGVLFIAITFPV